MKKTLKEKFPFFQTLSGYFSKFNLSNIGGFSHFEILSEGLKPSSKRERKISRREFTPSEKKRGVNGIGKFYAIPSCPFIHKTNLFPVLLNQTGHRST